MKSVTLLVTGRLEEIALANSLRQVFDEVTFDVRLVDGFTSARLPTVPTSDEKRPRYVDRIASRLVAEAVPGRQGKPPDLVVAIDDLELVNADQPAVVVEHLTSAVRRHVETLQAGRRDRAYEVLRERCSFHLLCPMAEAYFFGEPAALVRAGAERPSLFSEATTDVERFEVDDLAFLAPPDVEQKDHWRRSDRRRHPKRYLKFLSDASAEGDWTYKETREGVAALNTLAWANVLRHSDRALFARALFKDLADAFGQSSPFQGDVSTVTGAPGRDRILRNI